MDEWGGDRVERWRAKRRLIGAGVAGLLAGVYAGLRMLRRTASPAGARVRRAQERISRRRRYLGGRLAGLRYRLEGRHPTPNVADEVLADRVRSTLRPVEKRLDLPRVHVMVEHGVASLHGAVGTAAEERNLLVAAGRVSGVRSVRSNLHIGLGRGDSRPSAGPARGRESAARTRLVTAARKAANL